MKATQEEKVLKVIVVLDWMFWNEHPTPEERDFRLEKLKSVKMKELDFDLPPPIGGQANQNQ